jgi:hypothetical protein
MRSMIRAHLLALVAVGATAITASTALAVQTYYYYPSPSTAYIPSYTFNGSGAQISFEKKPAPYLSFETKVGANTVTIRCTGSRLLTTMYHNADLEGMTLHTKLTGTPVFSGCATVANPAVATTIIQDYVLGWHIAWTGTNAFDLTGVKLTVTFGANSCVFRTVDPQAIGGSWTNGDPSELSLSGSSITAEGDCSDPTSVVLPYRVRARAGPEGNEVLLR